MTLSRLGKQITEIISIFDGIGVPFALIGGLYASRPIARHLLTDTKTHETAFGNLRVIGAEGLIGLSRALARGKAM